MGWLDRLPTWARDLLLMLAASALGWAGTDVVPALRGKGGASAIAASALVLVIGALTPLTRAYGLGGRASGQDDPPASSGPPASV